MEIVQTESETQQVLSNVKSFISICKEIPSVFFFCGGENQTTCFFAILTPASNLQQAFKREWWPNDIDANQKGLLDFSLTLLPISDFSRSLPFVSCVILQNIPPIWPEVLPEYLKLSVLFSEEYILHQRIVQPVIFINECVPVILSETESNPSTESLININAKKNILRAQHLGEIADSGTGSMLQ